MHQHRRSTSYLKRLALLLTSFALSILFIEIGLSFLSIFPPVPYTVVGQYENRAHHDTFIVDPDSGWKMRSGASFQWKTEGKAVTYTADERGFRTWPGARQHAPKSMIFVGDSFLWGAGVASEETCASLVEKALPDYRVHNLSLPGYGVDQMMTTLRRWGPEIDPDLVVVGLYPSSFTRSLSAYRKSNGFNKPVFKVSGGELVAKTAEDRPGPFLRFLETRSRLFGILRRTSWWLGKKRGVGEWWRVNAAILRRIEELGREWGIPVLFVHVPSQEWSPFPALSRHMEERENRYLDLVALDPRRPAGIYYREDGHLNARGHGYLADAILGRIGEYGEKAVDAALGLVGRSDSE